MTSTHTLLEERDRFYSDLRFNKNRFDQGASYVSLPPSYTN